MLGLLGSFGVVVGLAAAVGLTAQGFRALQRPQAVTFPTVRHLALAVVAGASTAMLALVAGLLTDDFSLEYVANNHARSTPFPFDVATAWAALEGSIVLWGLVLAIFTWRVARSVTPSDQLGSGAMAVIGAVNVFFFGLMMTTANPFQVLATVPLDGPGPNALLQNHLLMAVHPPLLYAGLAGFTIPFGFAISALLVGRSGAEWLARCRRWTLVAWMYLTLGILMGGWWSYEVLGWGGFWAWDPVENASLLPWLTGTAFIHSAAVQLRRGMLQLWNLALVITTFALTILATFLTRSGVIGSVHSFAASAIGPVLLGFFVVILVTGFVLLTRRARLVASPARLESLASREGLFMVNNLLLTLFAFIVLTGTTYPILLEAFTGNQGSVGRPYFDRMAIPLSYLLLVAMALGPLTPYRLARPQIMWDRIRAPVGFGLLVGAVAVVVGLTVAHVVLILMLAAFIVASLARALWQSAQRMSRTKDLGQAMAVVRVMRNDAGYWGGQISHLGVVLIAIAIALYGNLAMRTEVALTPGQSTLFAGYEIRYETQFTREEPNRTVTGARVEVRRDDRTVGVLEPRLNQYPNQVQPIGTPAIRTGLTRNIYLTLRAIDADGISLEILVHPFLYLLWAGGLVTAGGGLWAWLAGKKKPPRLAVVNIEGTADA